MSRNLMRLGIFVGTAALVGAFACAQDRNVGRALGRASVDVYNPIEGRITIISSKPDGARVVKGEVVCELDTSELQDRLASEELAIQAAEADVRGARLAREVAAMAVIEYQEGLFVQDLQTAEVEIKLSESNLLCAEDTRDWARRMFDKGYVSMAANASEELSLKEARFALERAQSERRVLVDCTKNKTIKALLGAVEAALVRRTGPAGGARAGAVCVPAATRLELRVRRRVRHLLETRRAYEREKSSDERAVRLKDEAFERIVSPPTARVTGRSPLLGELLEHLTQVREAEDRLVAVWTSFRVERLSLYREVGTLPYNDWASFYKDLSAN